MPNRTPISEFLPSQVSDRPIVNILEELTSDEMSRLAVDVIVKNRRPVERAQSLFDQLEEPVASDCDKKVLRYSYFVALLALKLHHELVRIVVDRLGYVPEISYDTDLH